MNLDFTVVHQVFTNTQGFLLLNQLKHISKNLNPYDYEENKETF